MPLAVNAQFHATYSILSVSGGSVRFHLPNGWNALGNRSAGKADIRRDRMRSSKVSVERGSVYAESKGSLGFVISNAFHPEFE